MKLLSEDLLSEYGFTINEERTTRFVKVFTRDKLEIVLKEDGAFYYSNLGFDYPLRELAALRKLYKEIRREELKPF